MTRKIKCVVVGDNDVGKASLLFSYTTSNFPSVHVPVFENKKMMVIIGGESYMLELWDTTGQEDYTRLRPISYPDTSVFVVCFSVVNPASFENVRDTWVPEIMDFCPRVPFILVGTETDLRSDPDTVKRLDKKGQRPITTEHGENLATDLKAVKYVECSARHMINVKTVFDEAMHIAASKSGRRRCTTM